MTSVEILKSIKDRAIYYKDKDDYLGIFTVAQVLWLVEEIERKDRVIGSLTEDWARKRASEKSGDEKIT